MNNKLELGKKITKARKDKKMTQQELAVKLHVTDKAVSNWETGRNTPDIELLKKIEQELDIELIDKVVDKKQNRKKVICIILTITHLVITSFLLIYFINNYNKINIYELTLKNNIFTIKDSYIIVSNNDLIIDLGKIENTTLPYQPSYEINLYYQESNQQNPITIKSNYETLTLNYQKNHRNYKLIKENLDNLYIQISYTDYEDKLQTEQIKLNLSSKISNNSLFYSNKGDVFIPNQNTVNLLKNNNYTEVDNNIWEKKINNDYYSYDIKKDIFYYEGTYQDVSIYAKIDSKDTKTFAVIKNNNVIAYSIRSTSNLDKYEDIISGKLKEKNKLINPN